MVWEYCRYALAPTVIGELYPGGREVGKEGMVSKAKGEQSEEQ